MVKTEAAVAVDTSETDVIEYILPGHREGLPEVGVQIKNAGAAALTELNLYGRVSPGADWVKMVETLVDWSTGLNAPLAFSVSSDGTFNLLAASANVLFSPHMGALHSIKVTAKCGTSTTLNAYLRDVN